MSRLSKKIKQKWNFFINPNTGRRTYNKFCFKCKKQMLEKYGEIRLNKEKGVTPLSGLHHNSLNTALLACG